MIQARNKQQGATLLISLVMLVLLTLFAVSAVNMTNVNLKIADNMQVREESRAVGQQAIEMVISKDFTAPGATFNQADLTNEGSFQITVSKACQTSVPIKNSELDPSKDEDHPCFGSGAAQNTGLIYSGDAGATTNEWCAKQQWDIAAEVKDARTASVVTVHQGTGLRVEAGTACP